MFFLDGSGMPGCQNVLKGGDSMSKDLDCEGPFLAYIVYRSFKYPPPIPPLKKWWSKFGLTLRAGWEISYPNVLVYCIIEYMCSLNLSCHCYASVAWEKKGAPPHEWANVPTNHHHLRNHINQYQSTKCSWKCHLLVMAQLTQLTQRS